MIEAPVPPRRRPRVTLLLGTAVLVAGLGLMAALTFGDTGDIRYRGRLIQIPVSAWRLKIASSEGRVTYIVPGHPDLAGIFSRRGEAFGWGAGDQLGSFIAIPSTRNDGLQLIVLIQQRTRFFTQFDIQVRGTAPP